MEETNSSKQSGGEERFLDALDDFSFYDCSEAFSESNGDVSTSAASPNPSTQDKSPPPAGLRRRRSLPRHRSPDSDSTEFSTVSSSVNTDNNSRERYTRLSRDCENKLKNSTKNSSEFPKSRFRGEKIEMNEEHSTVTDANANAHEDLQRGEPSLGESNEANSGSLFMLAGIVIKSISFQISFFVKFVMFPIRLLYYLYMLMFNPFGLVLLCKGFLIRKMRRIWNFVFGIVSEYVYEWLKEHRVIWKLGLKCGWGLLWSAYVCAVLVGLLVSAFVMGGILIRVVVADPIRIHRNLNFDYLEKSPAAFVPITTHTKLNQNIDLMEKPGSLKAGGSWVLPRNHRLKVTVSLTLPESEYNQHLGIFQVRVDFLGADGRTLATSKRPCMLQYKSQSIRLLLTLLKVAPILSGYSSETQNLKISFKDFTEGETPTAWLRVVIEQRAEYSVGAGIPEIYAAALTLESELPLLKRMLWFWKTTLFVWVSMSIFMVELVFALLCCRPIIIPTIRLREPTTDRPVD